jgi:Flp pilus assembly protein TadG
MRTLNIRRFKREEGATLVEFSLVAVLLVIVLLSVAEMGRMVLVYTTMANAARAGARYAIVHGGDRSGSGIDGPSGPSDYSQVTTVVRNFAAAGLLTASKVGVTVTYLDGDNLPGDHVSVTVTYTYDPMIGYFNSSLAKSLGSTSEGVIDF